MMLLDDYSKYGTVYHTILVDINCCKLTYFTGLKWCRQITKPFMPILLVAKLAFPLQSYIFGMIFCNYFSGIYSLDRVMVIDHNKAKYFIYLYKVKCTSQLYMYMKIMVSVPNYSFKNIKSQNAHQYGMENCERARNLR